MEGSVWFNGWDSVGRIVLFALIAYAVVLALVRTLGKRTISTKNPSDFVITVAVGSLIANWVLHTPISLVDGVAAVTTMLALQALTESLTTRSERLRKLSEGEPTLIAYDGRFVAANMRREHVNEHEVLESVRQEGLDSLDDVQAVVLEIDGSFSVVRRSDRPGDALRDVRAHS